MSVCSVIDVDDGVETGGLVAMVMIAVNMFSLDRKKMSSVNSFYRCLWKTKKSLNKSLNVVNGNNRWRICINRKSFKNQNLFRLLKFGWITRGLLMIKWFSKHLDIKSIWQYTHYQETFSFRHLFIKAIYYRDRNYSAMLLYTHLLSQSTRPVVDSSSVHISPSFSV